MLSGHAIGAEGAAAFGAALGGENGNSTLRRLCLGSQAFGDAGVEALASFMCTWNALEDLDLELKGITATGAGHLGHGLAENTTVKKVNLSRNDLKDAGVAALLETCWISTAMVATNPVHLAKCQNCTCSNIMCRPESYCLGVVAS